MSTLTDSGTERSGDEHNRLARAARNKLDDQLARIRDDSQA
jgi:hypothetical protein